MATSSSTLSDIVTLYYDPLSQPCRAVQMFLGLNGIDCDTREIVFSEGSSDESDLAKVNPLKKVPVIEHKGRVVKECAAILRYLSREYPVEDRWYPEDSIKRARVDEYLEWHHLETRAKSVIYVFATFRQEARSDQCRSRLVKTCDLLDQVWLRDSPFLGTQELSIADLVAACELEQLSMTDFDIAESRPRLADWMSRVRKETSPIYEAVHNFLREFCAAKIKSVSRIDFDK